MFFKSKNEEVAEAIELLNKMQHDKYVVQNHTENELISLAITALKEYQSWVSVEDRLPADGTPVLTTYVGVHDGKLYSDGIAIWGGIAIWDIKENRFKGRWLWNLMIVKSMLKSHTGSHFQNHRQED